MSVVAEGVRKNPTLGIAVGVGMILLAAIVVGWTYWPEQGFAEDKTFFSIDDGKTWYADSTSHIPPYTYQGKEAVRAVVYSYANGSKQMCGYLQRFGPGVRPAVEAAVAAGAKRNPPESAHSIAYGINFGTQLEVKAPGKGEWVPLNSVGGTEVVRVKAPDGSELDQVLP